MEGLNHEDEEHLTEDEEHEMRNQRVKHAIAVYKRVSVSDEKKRRAEREDAEEYEACIAYADELAYASVKRFCFVDEKTTGAAELLSRPPSPPPLSPLAKPVVSVSTSRGAEIAIGSIFECEWDETRFPEYLNLASTVKVCGYHDKDPDYFCVNADVRVRNAWIHRSRLREMRAAEPNAVYRVGDHVQYMASSREVKVYAPDEFVWINGVIHADLEWAYSVECRYWNRKTKSIHTRMIHCLRGRLRTRKQWWE